MTANVTAQKLIPTYSYIITYLYYISILYIIQLNDTPSVLCLAHEFTRNYFFSCERPILSKPIWLDSIGEDVHFDVYLQCLQKKSRVS